MRVLDKIIIHSSATLAGMNIGVDKIREWHTDPPPKGRGWSDIGYHFVIRRDGTLEQGRPVGEVGAHTRGHNRNSIGICWIGGVVSGKVAKDNRTDWQKEMLIKLILSLKMVFGDLEVVGHRDLANTECPSFNAKEEYGMD